MSNDISLIGDNITVVLTGRLSRSCRKEAGERGIACVCVGFAWARCCPATWKRAGAGAEGREDRGDKVCEFESFPDDNVEIRERLLGVDVGERCLESRGRVGRAVDEGGNIKSKVGDCRYCT